MVLLDGERESLLVGLDWESGALTMCWMHGYSELPHLTDNRPTPNNKYLFFRTAYRYREVWIKNLANCGIYTEFFCMGFTDEAA